jgi:hypothetical protein
VLCRLPACFADHYINAQMPTNVPVLDNQTIIAPLHVQLAFIVTISDPLVRSLSGFKCAEVSLLSTWTPARRMHCTRGRGPRLNR